MPPYKWLFCSYFQKMRKIMLNEMLSRMCTHFCELCKDMQRPITFVASRRELDHWGMKIEGRHFTGYQCFSNYLLGNAPIFLLSSITDQYTAWMFSFSQLSVSLNIQVWLQADLFPFPGLESTGFSFALQCHIATKVPNSLISTPNFSWVPEKRVHGLALPYTFLYFWIRDITYKNFF